MKTQETAQVIAESYINGNLSWVKNECRKNPALIAQVIQELKEYAPKEAENFTAWVCMW